MTERKRYWWRACWVLGSPLQTSLVQTTKDVLRPCVWTAGTAGGTGSLADVGTSSPVSWRGGCKSGKARTKTLHWRRPGREDESLVEEGKAMTIGTRPLSLLLRMVLRGCRLGGVDEVGSVQVCGSGPESRRKKGRADEKVSGCDLEGKRDEVVGLGTSVRRTAVRGARPPWPVKGAARSKRGGGRERLGTLRQ